MYALYSALALFAQSPAIAAHFAGLSSTFAGLHSSAFAGASSVTGGIIIPMAPLAERMSRARAIEREKRRKAEAQSSPIIKLSPTPDPVSPFRTINPAEPALRVCPRTSCGIA